jgi:hypothetical protein
MPLDTVLDRLAAQTHRRFIKKRTDRMVIFRSTGRHRYRRHLVSAGGRPPLLLRLSWHLH